MTTPPAANNAESPSFEKSISSNAILQSLPDHEINEDPIAMARAHEATHDIHAYVGPPPVSLPHPTAKGDRTSTIYCKSDAPSN